MKYIAVLSFVILISCSSEVEVVDTTPQPLPGIDISYYQGQIEPKIDGYPTGTPLVVEYTNADFPESTYANDKYLFVANINGVGLDKDGNGWIAKMPLGKLPQKMTPWVSGLNAPKGMRASKGTLWVADIDTVVAIDIAAGKITQKIELADSGFLNDIAVDNDGNIYVSDTLKSRIWKITDGKASIWDEGKHLESPNGLLVDGDKLIVAAFGYLTELWKAQSPGKLYSLDLKTKDKKDITGTLGNLDGLEKYDDNHYLVSDWPQGKIFAVNKNGEKKVIVHGILGAADIGFASGKKWLTIPRMGEDLITVLHIDSLEKLDGMQKKHEVKINQLWNKGRIRSAACNACHGREGNSGNTLWPNLRNQHRNYFVKALRDFRKGKRKHPLMTPAAKNLTDRDITYLSYYYTAYRDEPRSEPLNDEKWQKGKTKSKTCFTCHGTNGISPASMWPSLIKQSEGYLVKSMKDFRDGKRKDLQMNYVMKKFSDEDIEAVAYYFYHQ
ncbi:c-type cytochrome [Candidatus Uabimicrobium amorphum]|uniref:ATP/GTP-binding protein n=1 Tax=Uabimicrobium amorphum TaxID=2596890 RepID=A0A5S9IJ46_UABAM|nr:c-type cytochrome [Candidatus Uabimicrobium amorphum]BBM82829.1 ATP/GTP-binding protein [Candidatus Uabimicrobium amorphum]